MPTSTTPNIIVAVKLWIALPPNRSSASSASVTVTWVMMERDSVELIETLSSSVNSTLSRSIITHVTVTLALLALLLFGGHAIHSFTATMMFGVVLVGTYTSVFIAAPILIYLGVGTGRELRKDKDEG